MNNNNSEIKILIVDDEEDILEFLSYNFKKEGFNTYCSSCAESALKMANDIIPDIFIVDIMMPKIDGFEFVKMVRSNENLADKIIIFLTARSDEFSNLKGYEVGADDYITKPVKPSILISKIKALTKRFCSKDSFNDIILDKESFVVKYNNKDFVVTKKEFELLELLLSKPNKVFTREEIYSKVWGDNVIVGDRTIDVHIRKIREKTGIPNIVTIKGVGYKFSVNV